jgi:ATP-dependent RNA helicase DHX8/PRP22
VYVDHQSVVSEVHLRFAGQVCPVEEKWVAPLLDKLHNIDVVRLSRGSLAAAEVEAGVAPANLPPQVVEKLLQKRNDESKVNAAKERFLARKKARMA